MSKKNSQEKKNPTESQESFSSGYSSLSLSSPRKNSSSENIFGKDKSLDIDYSYETSPKLNNESSKNESSSRNIDKKFLLKDEDVDKDFNNFSNQPSPIQSLNEENSESSLIGEFVDQIEENEKEPEKMLEKKRKRSSEFDLNFNFSDEE